MSHAAIIQYHALGLWQCGLMEDPGLNTEKQGTEQPARYSSHCLVDLSVMTMHNMKWGDPVIVLKYSANDQGLVTALCTVWPRKEVHPGVGRNLVLVDARTDVPLEAVKTHFLGSNVGSITKISSALQGALSPSVAIIAINKGAITVASNLKVSLSMKNTSSLHATPCQIDLCSPRVTAMVKTSLRQLCLCVGAAVSVPVCDEQDSKIQVRVIEGKPLGCVAWWVGLSTLILAEVEESKVIVIPKNIVAHDSQEREGGVVSGLEVDAVPGTSSSAAADQLLELVLLPHYAPAMGKFVPRGVLLSGPPGVGKTYAVVQAAARSLSECGIYCSLHVINGSELLAMGFGEGEAELRRVFAEAHGSTAGAVKGNQAGAQRSSSIIFLDEIDALLAKRESGGGSRSRILTQLLTLMDGFTPTPRTAHGGSKNGSDVNHVLVVGATNRPHALDSALRRPGRFDREVTVSPPGEIERLHILEHHCRKLSVEGGRDTLLEVAKMAIGYVGADLAALSREVALAAAFKNSKTRTNDPNNPKSSVSVSAALANSTDDKPTNAIVSFDSTCITTSLYNEKGAYVHEYVDYKEGGVSVKLQDFENAMEKVGASSLRGHSIEVPAVGWDDIGGMDQAKMQLRRAVEWPRVHSTAFKRIGLAPPRGILLYGPPGCSKTTLVKAAATASSASFISLSGADVYSPYVGEAEAAVRKAFQTARGAAPCILFFDELDAIVGSRGKGGTEAEGRVLATFLNEMDGVDTTAIRDDVMVMAATNRPEAIDSALLRPGRFDQLIHVPLPDREGRRRIFSVHTRKIPLADDVELDILADKADGLTGAEIEAVCREGSMIALREEGMECQHVAMRHLTAALSTVPPRVTPGMLKIYNSFALRGQRK